MYQRPNYKTLTILGENIDVYVDTGNDFLNRTPIAQEIRARIDKWNLLRFKTV
jgi:hypothetical protein